MRALAVLIFLIATSTGPTHAQIADLRSVAERSDAIVLARCTEAHSHWDDDARVIVTDVTLAVERSYKGDAPPTAIVRTLGGRVGTIGMGASHAASFAPGARVVALLRRSRFGAYFVVTSADAGPLAVSTAAGGARIVMGGQATDLETLIDQLGVDPR